jgi:hypothetical protein
LRDPFSDSSSIDTLASGPASSAGITVVGIVIMKSGKKFAMLKVPGYGHAMLVREGDVVKARSDGGAKGTVLDVDVAIRTINESEVEIVSGDDPENVIVVR